VKGLYDITENILYCLTGKYVYLFNCILDTITVHDMFSDIVRSPRFVILVYWFLSCSKGPENITGVPSVF